MKVSTFNGNKLLPMKKRYGMNHRKKRAAKKQDRSDFRMRVERTFTEVGRGMGIFDACLATVYSRGRTYAIVNIIAWLVLVAWLVWGR